MSREEATIPFFLNQKGLLVDQHLGGYRCRWSKLKYFGCTDDLHQHLSKRRLPGCSREGNSQREYRMTGQRLLTDGDCLRLRTSSRTRKKAKKVIPKEVTTEDLRAQRVRPPTSSASLRAKNTLQEPRENTMISREEENGTTKWRREY